MKINTQIWSAYFLFLLGLSACTQTTYVYEITPLTLHQHEKTNKMPKSAAAFIRIAWSDLYGASINPIDLESLLLSYESFGDKQLFEEMMIRSFLEKDKSNPSENFSLLKIRPSKVLVSETPFEDAFESAYFVCQAFWVLSEGNYVLGSANYSEWKKSNAPNSPFFVEKNIKDSLESIKWLSKNCAHWKDQYPNEFLATVQLAKQNIELWKSNMGKDYKALINYIEVDWTLRNPNAEWQRAGVIKFTMPVSPIEMRHDPDAFITKTYQNFLNRLPSPYEASFLRQKIQTDLQVSPILIYYSIMTSTEYRNF